MTSTLMLTRLQRAFALRPASPCFYQFRSLWIFGHDRVHNTIESSALHYLIERLKHNPIECFSLTDTSAEISLRIFDLNVLETYLLKSCPPRVIRQSMLNGQVRAILYSCMEPDADSQDDDEPFRSLYFGSKKFVESGSCERFFRALHAALSPKDRAMLARYDQGFYEEPMLHRSSQNKRKAEQ